MISCSFVVVKSFGITFFVAASFGVISFVSSLFFVCVSIACGIVLRTF